MVSYEIDVYSKSTGKLVSAPPYVSVSVADARTLAAPVSEYARVMLSGEIRPSDFLYQADFTQAILGTSGSSLDMTLATQGWRVGLYDLATLSKTVGTLPSMPE